MAKEPMQQTKERMLATKLPTTVNDVPDHLLKLILRRLDSHVSFLRAAAVCTRWRRIASTRGAKYRDLNHHHFFTTLGHYHVVDSSFSPEPRSSQAQRCRRVVFIPASPSIDARHFSLDFLPRGRGGRPWELVDGYGSLLLVTTNQQRGCFPDLVVCEPSSRRYIRIKPAEDMKYSHCLGVFLNGRYSGVMSMSSFSLTCVVYERAAGIAGGVSFVRARVYTHEPPWCRRWRHGWSSSRHAMPGGIHIRGAESAHYAGRSKGYIFWAIENDGSVFAAREGTGATLSHFHLPENVRGSSYHRSTFRFVDDGADDLVRVVSLIGDDLRVFIKEEHKNGWVLVQSLHLPEATLGLQGYKEGFFSRSAKIVRAGKGYVVLKPTEETWLFSIKLGTMQVEREHYWNRLAGEVYPYELRLQPKVRVCTVSYGKRGPDGPCYDICKCN